MVEIPLRECRPNSLHTIAVAIHTCVYIMAKYCYGNIYKYIQDDESESAIIALNRVEPGAGNFCRVTMSLPDQKISKRSWKT